jgi:hypothetical protein
MPTRQHQILDRTPSRWWFGAPILLAATAIGALLLLPGTLRGGPVTAWLLLLALLGGGAVVPLRRWLMWSPENRWRSVCSVVPAALLALAATTVVSVAGVAVVLAIEVPGSGLLGRVHLTLLDGNTLVVVVVGALAGTFSLRRPTPLAVVQWSLRHDVSASVGGDAAAELRRLRAWRTLPAVLGFAIGNAPGPAYNLAIDTVGPSHPAAETLLAAVGGAYDGFTFAVVGYLLGVVAAEVTRRRPAGDAGVARLDARRSAGYLTDAARRLPPLLATWVVAAAGVGSAVGRAGPLWPVVGAVLLAAGVTSVQRYVIQRPQRLTDPDQLALDDALRSSVAHALAGGASALLLVWALSATQSALVGNGTPSGAVGVILGVGGSVGVVALWMHYGSAHHGRQPGRAGTTLP